MRYIYLVLTLSVLCMMAGCSGQSTKGDESEATFPNQTSEGMEESGPQSSSGTSVDLTSDAKSLVVYFSWSGNTQQMSEWIAEESGSDLYQITPTEEYGADFNTCADRAREELDNGIRPQLDDLMDVETMVQYDTVYVGFPIWWYDLPMPVAAFLENYDLSGKTVIPFFSHNGSSSGASSLGTLAGICESATLLSDDALSVSGSNVGGSESEIRDWVNNLGE